MPRTPDELRELIEGYLAEHEPAAVLGTLVEPYRYSLGGKRVRPGALPGEPPRRSAPISSGVLPAAAAVELVHSFSLVHDDLPALDDDEERRGQPSVWAAYGEATAILAGDALAAEAFRPRARCAAPTSRAS